MLEVELEPEVEDWLISLNEENYATAKVQVDRLERMGSTIREPWSKALGDGLYELRFDIDKVAWRISYFYAEPTSRSADGVPKAAQQRATRSPTSTRCDAPLHRRA